MNLLNERSWKQLNVTIFPSDDLTSLDYWVMSKRRGGGTHTMRTLVRGHLHVPPESQTVAGLISLTAKALQVAADRL